jgi:hypothetical protein
MTADELLRSLLVAETAEDVLQLVDRFIEADPAASWAPVGGRPNNRGIIEVSANPGRALVERVTNAVDAVLDAQYIRHSGTPTVESPREAASAWLNVPDAGLSGMSAAERRRLAQNVTVRLRPGDGLNKRVVEIVDRGTGLTASEMPETILSLNESNKVEKLHQAGTYGQGGSATFAASDASLIASQKDGTRAISFTVVRFEPPPADAKKGGSYVYLVVGGKILTVDANDLLASGTLCAHFGYDLTKFPSPLGPNSIYGLLQQVVFDPILPVWFDNRVNDYRRVIKGSRNALNGAVDEGDSAASKLSHHMPMFYVSLGDYGRAGIEYWVLEPPAKGSTRPTASFVDPNKPIILTINGQNQAELPIRLVRKEAELPYLAQRLICHVDCNSLTPTALRSLFASNREDARRGAVFALLEREVIEALRSDDELERLNAEARDQKYKREDEETSKTMRKEVARLLRLQGYEVSTDAGAAAGGDEKGRAPGRRRGPRPKPRPLELREPPTYIRIVWPDDEPIGLYPGQRRYVRIETDANSHYHDPRDRTKSAVNIVVNGAVAQFAGTTALTGGRMRVMVTCKEDAVVGAEGEVTVELRVPGMQTLADRRLLQIAEAPKSRPAQQRIVMPPFDVRPVEGPDDSMWATLGWPDDVKAIASSAVQEDGRLVVYYSRVYPRFAETFGDLATSDAARAESFESRYRIWLAVHSLILDKEEAEADLCEDERERDDDEHSELIERRERCRVATLATMFAAQEMKRSVALIEE